MAAKKIVYSSALATVVAVLIYLSSIPGVRITTSGDITCSVCTSYFNITSSNYSLKFYKFDQRLTFSPEIKNYTIYRYTYGKWRETKFPINMTKGTLYQFKLVGYKFNPSDKIKWAISSGDANVDPYWLAIEGKGGGVMLREYQTLTYGIVEEDPNYDLKINDLHETEKGCLYLDASLGLKKHPTGLSANFTTYNISSIETNIPFKINNYTVLLTLSNTSTLSTKQISPNFEICNIGNVTEIAPFTISLGSATTSVVAWFNANLEIYNGRINITLRPSWGTVVSLIDTNRTQWVRTSSAASDYGQIYGTDIAPRTQPFVGSLVSGAAPNYGAYVNTTLRINTPPMVWTYSRGNITQQNQKTQANNSNTQEFIILSGEDFFYRRVYLSSNTSANYSSDSSAFIEGNTINNATSRNFTVASCGAGQDMATINSTYLGDMGYILYNLKGNSDLYTVVGSSMNTSARGMYRFMCENDTKYNIMYHGYWGGSSKWLKSQPNNTLVNYRISFVPRVQMDFTGSGGSGLYNNLTRSKSILIGTSTITNRTSGCIQGMFGLNTSDFFTCNGLESNGVWALNVTIAPNANITGGRIYLNIGNLTWMPYQQIFIYNSSSAVPVANQLGLHLANETGTWVYVNDANMTKNGNATINAGTYNYTGIVNTGNTGFLMILQADAYASTNLIIQNVTMAVTGTTTTTTTTIPANCWTYDNVNHVLIIPSGCVYHNDTVGII